MVAAFHLSWQAVHEKYANASLGCSGKFVKKVPPIDEVQKMDLLHAPFKGITLFRPLSLLGLTLAD